MKNQLALFEWAEIRHTAKIIEGRPRSEAKWNRIVLDLIAGRWPLPIETKIIRLHARQEQHRDRRMIAKPTTSGEFVPEAQDGTSRVRTGPFPTRAAARRWFDQNQVLDTPKASPDPRRVPPVRQPRTNKSVTFADVEKLTEGMLARPDLIDIERE